MYPHSYQLFGHQVSIWYVCFFISIVVGYVAYRWSLKDEAGFSNRSFRYLIIVYLSAVAAQLFARAFDANGSLLPPPGLGIGRWYLNPLTGPKTLYGVIVLMPVSVAIARIGTSTSLGRALDLCTPAMLVVLAIARIGCFLQGCCYGAPSEWFSVSFADGSAAYSAQVAEGLIKAGDPAVPVVATQLIEALFLVILAARGFSRQKVGDTRRLFLVSAAVYSLFRFAIEFVRADADRGLYGPFATSQWIALLVLVVAGLVQAFSLKSMRNRSLSLSASV